MNSITQNENEIFEVVHTSEGKSKNRAGKIYIETSIRGLIYRTSVYLNDFLIDAKEISCIDLSTLENAQSVFRDRYLSIHNSFEMQYFLDKVYARVLSDEGTYIEGDGQCVVNTYIFENIIKNEVIVDDYEVDVLETEIDSEIAIDKKAFKLKYMKLHNSFVKDNIYISKFPVNTFLNPILKKFPLYNKKPMYAFYLFLVTVLSVLWILSLVICGKALVKIVKKVGGKEASLVVRDMQKSMCIRSSKKDEKDERKNLLYENLYIDGYLILPQKLEFKKNNSIKTIYIKNSMDGDLIVKLNNRVIDNFSNPLITPDMVLNVISKQRSIVVKPGGIGSFEFKIENTFLQSSLVEEGTYTGRLIFEVVKVKYNTVKSIPVSFSFSVIKQPESKEPKKEKKE